MSDHRILDKLLSDLTLSIEQFLRIVARAPRTYKKFTIAKKNGERRSIAQPARETKYVQNWLIGNVFDRLPIHKSATAYTKGASIKNNAFLHSTMPYIVKLDFKNFFPSILIGDVEAHLSRYCTDLSAQELKYISMLSCFDDQGKTCLSVGSPASPILSNSILFQFDTLVFDWAKANGFIYTRYADDLTFSTSVRGASSLVLPKVLEFLAGLEYPRIILNEKKTIHLSKKSSRRITGLIISNDGKVSLGRDRKREISVMVHKHLLGLLCADDLFKLQGLLGFAQDVEPLFLSRLRAKYGTDALRDLLAMRAPPKDKIKPAKKRKILIPVTRQ